MSSGRLRAALYIISFTTALFLAACGGGGAGSKAQSSPVLAQPLTITTDSILPSTLQTHAYQAQLNASGGQGALHWSISKISPTTSFVDGLSIDANTGLISGTANFLGTDGFTATVSDSALSPQTVNKNFTITAYGLLVAGPDQTLNSFAFQGPPPVPVSVQGGFPPLTYSIAGGAPPLGIRLDRTTGIFSGAATAAGAYQFVVTIQDSFSPPESVSQKYTLNVAPATLSVAQSLPAHIALNQPFTGRIAAVGGTPPYVFTRTSGGVPPGVGSIDPGSGSLTGTPTAIGTYGFTVKVTDSGSPQQSASQIFSLTVAQSNRNDTVATATPIDNGFFSASISPYTDPANGLPLPGDTDYYKLASFPGATVHVETQAKRTNINNPLDTVIEIVDANGNRFANCRQPGDTGTVFTSACINDDISDNPHVQDSALDFQVPGSANTATTFYVHVFDFRGDARPDMTYSLQVSGAAPPLTILTTSLMPAINNNSFYDQNLQSRYGSGTISWSLASGNNLPPGLTLNSNGTISGRATTDGVFPFTVQAMDSGNPTQTATAQETIQVVDPIQITSPATLPDACVNQPYTFAAQATGGLPPFRWSVNPAPFAGLTLDQFAGTFSGTPTVIGTQTGFFLSAVDTAGDQGFQQIMLTIKQCP